MKARSVAVVVTVVIAVVVAVVVTIVVAGFRYVLADHGEQDAHLAGVGEFGELLHIDDPDLGIFHRLFELLQQLSPALDPNEIIEDFVYAQFNESDGQIAMAGFQPGSISEAQVMLFEEFNHDLLMPAIKGAELTQVMYTDFAPGYKTPVLEYFQEDSNEYIYVFAFKIDSLENNQKLIRDPDAVEKCKSSDDYHIKDVNGNHVVSWKWKDNWYVAVSNHNGNDLAAIIEPMDQSLYIEE
jgi:hypothetical protein